MKHARRGAMVVGLLLVPAIGSAQGYDRVSFGIGLAAGVQPTIWETPALTFDHGPSRAGLSFGLGVGRAHGIHDDGQGRLWIDGALSACLEIRWHDPFFDCSWLLPRTRGSLYGPWRGHRGHIAIVPVPLWPPVAFFVWPPYRVGWRWSASAWRWPGWGGHVAFGAFHDDARYDRRLSDARWSRRQRDRIVRRSPLFGPRYKEDPRVHVADAGPRRPRSTARPRTRRAGVGPVPRNPGTDAGRRARPRAAEDRAQVRPRPTAAPPRPDARARPTTPVRPGREARPRASRPQAFPRPGRVDPRRATEARGARPRTVVSAPRRAPAARPRAERRPAPKVRPAPKRPERPSARPAPPKRKPSASQRPPARRPPAAKAPRRAKPRRPPKA